MSWYARLPLDALPVWTAVTPLVISVAVAATYAWVRWSPKVPSRGFLLASIALLWALFFFTPPFTTQRLDDLNHYYFHGKMLARYGLNPYTIAPAAAAQDPDYPAVAVWHWFRFNYGPLWLAVTALVALVVSRLAEGVLVLRGILVAVAAMGGRWSSRLSAVAFSSTVASVEVEAKVDLGGRRGATSAGVAWALHPLLLVWGLSGGHNDVVVAALLLATLALAQRGRWQGAALAVAAAALVKPATAVWWPVFWLAGVTAAGVGRRLRVGGQMALAAFGLATAAYLPVWPGWATIAGSIPTANPLLAGPLVAMLRPWLAGWAPLAAAIGFGVVELAALVWLARRSPSLDRIAAAGLVVGLALLAASPLLQPWYALWLVPFLLALDRPWARWLEAGVIVASLTFYPLWYPVGWVVAAATVAGVTVALWGLARTLRGRPWPTP